MGYLRFLAVVPARDSRFQEQIGICKLNIGCIYMRKVCFNFHRLRPPSNPQWHVLARTSWFGGPNYTPQIHTLLFPFMRYTHLDTMPLPSNRYYQLSRDPFEDLWYKKYFFRQVSLFYNFSYCASGLRLLRSTSCSSTTSHYPTRGADSLMHQWGPFES